MVALLLCLHPLFFYWHCMLVAAGGSALRRRLKMFRLKMKLFM